MSSTLSRYAGRLLFRGSVGLLYAALASVATILLHGQDVPKRQIVALAATASGTSIIALINDDGAESASRVFMVSPATGRVIWEKGKLASVASLAFAPDGGTVAIGFVGVPDSAAGVLLLQTQSGNQLDALGYDETLNFAPGVVYPRYGSGVSQLAYSSDGKLLYGLSNDTLFVWDVASKRYLWTKDVPAVIEAPPDLPDPLPYGHATGLALSPDGRQIAAIRDALRIANAGPAKPGHFIKREASSNVQIANAAFSADSKILAAGEFGTTGKGKVKIFATDLWIAGATRSVTVAGCGGGIAWSGAADVFACQNETGAHLRNIHTPQTDIGTAGPVSDLPLLKVGNSIWAAAYRSQDWKDPAKPLPLTLVEAGTGRRVTLTLPGRP